MLHIIYIKIVFVLESRPLQMWLEIQADGKTFYVAKWETKLWRVTYFKYVKQFGLNFNWIHFWVIVHIFKWREINLASCSPNISKSISSNIKPSIIFRNITLFSKWDNWEVNSPLNHCVYRPKSPSSLVLSFTFQHCHNLHSINIR